jgi:hypothetical protein
MPNTSSNLATGASVGNGKMIENSLALVNVKSIDANVDAAVFRRSLPHAMNDNSRLALMFLVVG